MSSTARPDFALFAEGKDIRLWEVATGKELRRIPGGASYLVFSPDDKYLATIDARSSNFVRLLEVASGNERLILDCRDHGPRQVLFLPDGQSLVTAGGDGTIRLWDLANGEERSRFTGHIGEIRHIAIAPDGQRILSASADNTAILWDVPTVLASAPPVEEPIFERSASLQVVANEGVGGEGPAWHPKLGVFCSGNNNLNRVDPTCQVHVVRKDAGTNGLLFDRQGRLLACDPKERRVTRREADGRITVLTDRFQGKRYNSPNDLTLDSQGRIYFSDPRYGSREGMELASEGVYRIDPDGKVTRVVDREVERANGVLVSADDRYLYVADNNNNRGGARKLWRFDLHKDGSVDPASRKLIYDWGKGRGPDGFKQDQRGRLYVAAGLNRPNPPSEPDASRKGGIYVLSLEGKLLTFLPVPRDEVTNCAFGGEDLRTLYITAGGTLYRIGTATPGRVVWPVAK